MNQELEAIIAQLEAMSDDKVAQMFITVETGHDECDIAGTRDAYLRLAGTLLAFVSAVDKGEIVPNATGMPNTSAIGYIFNSDAEVGIDSMTMSETEQQARERMEYLRDL